MEIQILCCSKRVYYLLGEIIFINVLILILIIQEITVFAKTHLLVNFVKSAMKDAMFHAVVMLNKDVVVYGETQFMVSLTI